MLALKSHRLIMDQEITVACHASTVLPLENGHVLVAWFGGSHEHNDDVSIYLAEKDEKGFGAPRLMASTLEPHWNPVLYQHAGGRIQLFYKVGREIRDWRTYTRESDDLGRTWTPTAELVPGDVSGGRGPVRNKPIQLKNGRILAPASIERGLWVCFMDISDDGGRTWKRSNIIEAQGTHHLDEGLKYWQEKMLRAKQAGAPMDRSQLPPEYRHGRGVIQPTLWEDEEGVHALLRSGEGFIYRTDSADQGDTWCEAYPIQVPNNNSGIDLTRLEDGTLLLAYNPIGQSFGLRSPISLAASRDNGRAWEKLCDLETEPGEFSYPAIVSRGGKIFLTYTWKRKNIAYWEFEW